MSGSPPIPFARPPLDSERVGNLVQAIVLLVRDLSPVEKDALLKRLNEALRPIQTPKAGDVLGVVVQLLPKTGQWTVEQIKQEIDRQGVEATPKEVYNAVGYLARRGHIKKIGYGRYIMDGAAIVTPDDDGPDLRSDESYQVNT